MMVRIFDENDTELMAFEIDSNNVNCQVEILNNGDLSGFVSIVDANSIRYIDFLNIANNINKSEAQYIVIDNNTNVSEKTYIVSKYIISIQSNYSQFNKSIQINWSVPAGEMASYIDFVNSKK